MFQKYLKSYIINLPYSYYHCQNLHFENILYILIYNDPSQHSQFKLNHAMYLIPYLKQAYREQKKNQDTKFLQPSFEPATIPFIHVVFYCLIFWTECL